MSHPVPDAPARARQAVARYLPAGLDESRFARGMAAYARCQDGCRDRAAGEPECRDSCSRLSRKNRTSDRGHTLRQRLRRN